MAHLAELVGGPLDGDRVRSARSFVWVARTRKGVVCYGIPGGVLPRYLYRRADVSTYLYAHHLYARCVGCGNVHRRGVGSCTLCGGELTV